MYIQGQTFGEKQKVRLTSAKTNSQFPGFCFSSSALATAKNLGHIWGFIPSTLLPPHFSGPMRPSLVSVPAPRFRGSSPYLPALHTHQCHKDQSRKWANNTGCPRAVDTEALVWHVATASLPLRTLHVVILESGSHT